MEYAIVLPAGSGKTTLASKYPHLVDIDSLHTVAFRPVLRRMYDECRKTGDWHSYNRLETAWLEPRLKQFTNRHILLLHCPQKATLLRLTLLGQWKVSQAVMRQVALKRDDRRDLVAHNWHALKDATVVETHADIEAIVVGELERVHSSKTSTVDIMHDDGRLMGCSLGRTSYAHSVME